VNFGDTVEGTLYSSPSDIGYDPVSQEARKVLVGQKISAEVFTMNAYAVVQVIVYGLDKAGDAEASEAVAGAIKSGEAIPTIIGRITYGDRGDMTSKVFSLFRWHNGKTVPAE